MTFPPTLPPLRVPAVGVNSGKFCEQIHKEGLGTFDSESSTAGIGIVAGKIAVGSTRTVTSGTFQSTLSQITAPPAAPAGPLQNLITGVVLAVFGIPILIAGLSASSGLLFWCGLGAIFLAAVAFLDLRNQPQRQANFSAELTKWKVSKMCTRCGHVFE